MSPSNGIKTSIQTSIITNNFQYIQYITKQGYYKSTNVSIIMKKIFKIFHNHKADHHVTWKLLYTTSVVLLAKW